MSGQNWSIIISPSKSNGPAVYTPDLSGAAPGSALQTGNADIVSWNNRTGDKHQPVYTDSSGNVVTLCDVIKPWEPSTPGYVTQASTTEQSITIDYTCTFHPNEQGSLIIWNQ